MPIVRHSPSDIDPDVLRKHLEAAAAQDEATIERHAEEDGGALTDEELARMVLVLPHVKPRAAE